MRITETTIAWWSITVVAAARKTLVMAETIAGEEVQELQGSQKIEMDVQKFEAKYKS